MSQETKKVKILVPKFQHEGRDFYQDDLVTVDIATAKYFCRAGWAEDPSGEIPTGSPGKHETVLQVEDMSLNQNTDTLGVEG